MKMEKQLGFKKFDGKIKDNYDEYLKQPVMIGFTEPFPVKDVLSEKLYTRKCRGFNVQFKVMLCTVTFGKENEYTGTAVVTDRVDVGSMLGANSFGSNCHVDEALTMEQAVVDYCKEIDFMISRKICSWPFAKAIVQENFYTD